MTLEEVMKFTYWWCQDLDQWQIKKQLGIGSHAAVDWDMFCREVCEVILFEKREKIGGPGKLVQIDESKTGKRKYHRGHVVEGQWGFGGIEEDSRKSFIETVENRTEETLLNLIKEGRTRHSHCFGIRFERRNFFEDTFRNIIHVEHRRMLKETVNRPISTISVRFRQFYFSIKPGSRNWKIPLK